MIKLNPLRIAFGIVCIVALMSANSQPKLPYTPYQIKIWEIKANEGYREWWYKDGIVNGKQSYSIGFGWNDQGCRRSEIKQFTKDGKVTFDEATDITVKELNKYGTLHKDPYKNVALQLYSYARGLTKDGRKLGRCCGGKNGCGHWNRDIRKSHNPRRQLELALWNHDHRMIIERTQDNRSKISKIIMTL